LQPELTTVEVDGPSLTFQVMYFWLVVESSDMDGAHHFLVRLASITRAKGAPGRPPTLAAQWSVTIPPSKLCNRCNMETQSIGEECHDQGSKW
jgi:hypothetical protein